MPPADAVPAFQGTDDPPRQHARDLDQDDPPTLRILYGHHILFIDLRGPSGKSRTKLPWLILYGDNLARHWDTVYMDIERRHEDADACGWGGKKRFFLHILFHRDHATIGGSKDETVIRESGTIGVTKKERDKERQQQQQQPGRLKTEQIQSQRCDTETEDAGVTLTGEVHGRDLRLETWEGRRRLVSSLQPLVPSFLPYPPGDSAAARASSPAA